MTEDSSFLNREETSLATEDDFDHFSFYVTFKMIPLYIILALAEGCSYIWRPLSILLYMVILLALHLAFWSILTRKARAKGETKLKEEELREKEQVAVRTSWVPVILVGNLVAFSQICRHLYLLFGGFVASQADYWHWLRFGISQILDNALFDTLTIYDWQISEIHATVFWSRIIVLLFNIYLETLVIVYVVYQFQVARTNWHRLTAIQHKQYFSFVFTRLGRLFVLALGLLPIFISLGAIIYDGSLLKATLLALRLGVPLMLGGWLAWNSLRALTFHGSWNKLFALTGIVVGIGLIYWNSPGFLALFH